MDELQKEIESLFKIVKIHVLDKFKVDVLNIDELKLRSRKRAIVFFRKTMMVILTEKYSNNYTQAEISKIFNLDRTSLIHHVKIHNNEYNRYSDYKNEYDKIISDFEEILNIREEFIAQ